MPPKQDKIWKLSVNVLFFFLRFAKQNQIKNRPNGRQFFRKSISGAGGGSLTRVACLEGRNNKRYTTPANL